jgi:hypothetical protein
MTRNRSIIGVLVLSALAVCAFGAANASAAGLTAYTCTNQGITPGTGEYKDSHCQENVNPKGDYSTVVIPVNQTTEVEGTAVSGTGTESGSSNLHATLGGVGVTITCTAMTSENAHIKNITVGEEMKVHGTTAVLVYTGCSAVAGAKEKPCTVTGSAAGVITTHSLTSTATEAAGGVHHVVFEPEEGNFTQFVLSGGECPSAVQNKGEPYPITGSATGTIPEGQHSHITFTGNVGGNLRVGEGAEAEYNGTNIVVMNEGGVKRTIGIKTS